MYYNNRYYFNRLNRGYAYGNPYRLNFSRRYPRVVVYSGQQNFGFIGDNWGKLLIAGGLAAAGLHHFAPDLLSSAVEHVGSGLGAAKDAVVNAAHHAGDFISDKWDQFKEWRDTRGIERNLVGVDPENKKAMASKIYHAAIGDTDYTYDPSNKFQKMIKEGVKNIQDANKPSVGDTSSVFPKSLNSFSGSTDSKLDLGLKSSDDSNFLSQEDITKGSSVDNRSPLRTTTTSSPYHADNIAKNPPLPRGPWKHPSYAGSSYGAWGDISKSDHGGFR